MRATVLVVLLALLGLVPGASGRPSPLAALVWLATLALPVGAYCGARRSQALLGAGLALAVMAVTLAAAQALGRLPLPSLGAGLAACAVLLALGLGVGSLLQTRPRTAVPLSALVVGALVLLPGTSSIQREPWPRAVRAILLDLSPATFAAECAGVDWMRHPAIYDTSGTVDFDPATRTAYRGSLAGGLVFVVGCAAARLRGRASRRTSAASV